VTQLVGLGTDDIAALGTDDVAGFNAGKLATLSTAQIAALGTDDLSALTSSQLAALNTAQLAVLDTATPASFFTAEQLSAMSNIQISTLASPLVVDLNGNGVSTMAMGSQALFDLNGDGILNRTGWVAGGDGLLARDLNGDGVINNGLELFGEFTQLADGSTARDGFEALADLDSTGDGVINSADDAFKSLVVWVDSNADGISTAGEIFSLAQVGIESISLTSVVALPEFNNGNVVALQGEFSTASGQTGLVADVWFQTDISTDERLVSSLADALERYGSSLAALEGGGSDSGSALDSALSSFSSTGEPVSAWGTAEPAKDLAALSAAEEEERQRLQKLVLVNPAG
jgi:trimeric autotransporter adhesin